MVGSGKHKEICRDVTSGNFCNRIFDHWKPLRPRIFDVDKLTCQFLELSSATVAFLVKYNYLRTKRWNNKYLPQSGYKYESVILFNDILSNFYTHLATSWLEFSTRKFALASTVTWRVTYVCCGVPSSIADLGPSSRYIQFSDLTENFFVMKHLIFLL